MIILQYKKNSFLKEFPLWKGRVGEFVKDLVYRMRRVKQTLGSGSCGPKRSVPVLLSRRESGDGHDGAWDEGETRMGRRDAAARDM